MNTSEAKLYLTGIYDTDFYLFDFLQIKTLISLTKVNKTIRDVAVNSNKYKQIIEIKGVKPNKRLVHCAQKGYLEIIKFYDCNKIKAKMNTLVIIASYYGYLEIVKYLVSLGADIKTNYDLPVQWASKNGHLETVKYLVSLGADIKPSKQ